MSHFISYFYRFYAIWRKLFGYFYSIFLILVSIFYCIFRTCIFVGLFSIQSVTFFGILVPFQRIFQHSHPVQQLIFSSFLSVFLSSCCWLSALFVFVCDFIFFAVFLHQSFLSFCCFILVKRTVTQIENALKNDRLPVSNVPKKYPKFLSSRLSRATFFLFLSHCQYVQKNMNWVTKHFHSSSYKVTCTVPTIFYKK